jgi:hypothetical protein
MEMFLNATRQEHESDRAWSPLPGAILSLRSFRLSALVKWS